MHKKDFHTWTVALFGVEAAQITDGIFLRLRRRDILRYVDKLPGETWASYLFRHPSLRYIQIGI